MSGPEGLRWEVLHAPGARTFQTLFKATRRTMGWLSVEATRAIVSELVQPADMTRKAKNGEER